MFLVYGGGIGEHLWELGSGCRRMGLPRMEGRKSKISPGPEERWEMEERGRSCLFFCQYILQVKFNQFFMFK